MTADDARRPSFRASEPLRLAERPIPEPGPAEARVRVEACGVCGSDVFLQKGGFGPGIRMPVVPGHEAAGVVDAVGPGVSEVARGDQVAIYYIDAPPDSRYARSAVRNIGPDVSGWASTSTARSPSTS
jgi:D-arabinose 1-dehydrogenase-like Zn-dependent alcohol dehydrogenase